jgi:predicted nuclease with TOPRIM domain
MATGNGHDPNTTRMVELLEQIVGRLDRVEQEVRGVREEVHELRGEVAAFKTEVRNELTEIHHEIADTNEALVALTGEVHELRADLKGPLETRVAKLEAAVFRPTGTG